MKNKRIIIALIIGVVALALITADPVRVTAVPSIRERMIFAVMNKKWEKARE